MRISDWSSDVCSSDLLRLQQILAVETDRQEHDDIFDGSTVIAAKVEELKAAARGELARIEAMGGAIAAVENAYMKEQLVESAARRLEAIESGEQTVVGVNAYRESEPSPLVAGADGGFLRSEEHTSELQSLMRISYAVFCLKKKT